VGWTLKVPPNLPFDALELPSDVLVRIQGQEQGQGLNPNPNPPYQLARINSPLDLKHAFNPHRFPNHNNPMNWTTSASQRRRKKRVEEMNNYVNNPPTPSRQFSPPPRVHNTRLFRRLVVGRISRLVPEKNPQTFVLVAAVVKEALLSACESSAREKKATNDAAANTAGGSSSSSSSSSSNVIGSMCLLPRFVLAGDGPLRQELEDLARENVPWYAK
jgi:glycosyltransferase involved in cell wall biosynthesis